MNLEDFKSFRRVLIPSEVGSIPTHSRQSSRGASIARVLVAFSIVCSTGAFGPGAAAQTLEVEGGAEPFERAVRSAIVPAWGQITNGKHRKAAVLFSAQAYLYARLVIETREGQDAERRANRLIAAGEDPDAPSLELQAAQASADDHFSRRRDMLFWAIIAAFYGAIDAYIDAHLGDFDEELDEGRELFTEVDPVERTLALGFRF